MAKCKRTVLLLLPCLLGLRDPFQPPEDRCAATQLSRWHYRGLLENAGRQVALVQAPSGKWRRLEVAQDIEHGWVVRAIDSAGMEITVGAECDPSHWRWQREGAKHESTDQTTTLPAADADNTQPAEQRKTDLPGGG